MYIHKYIYIYIYNTDLAAVLPGGIDAHRVRGAHQLVHGVNDGHGENGEVLHPVPVPEHRGGELLRDAEHQVPDVRVGPEAGADVRHANSLLDGVHLRIVQEVNVLLADARPEVSQATIGPGHAPALPPGLVDHGRLGEEQECRGLTIL